MSTVELSRSKELFHYPIFNKTWIISFDLKPLSIATTSNNIIHATIGRDVSEYGDRIPFVGLDPGKERIMVTSSIDGKMPGFTKEIPFESFTSVVIRQSHVFNETYEFSVFLNNSLEFNCFNTDARAFQNVTIYGSSPFYEPDNVVVRNLKVNMKGFGTGFFIILFNTISMSLS